MADAAKGTLASSVLHRNLGSELPLVVGGQGSYLVDSMGKRYLDASGGAAVSCLGHANPAIIEAIGGQLAKLAFAHTSFFSNEPSEALAQRLVAVAPAGFGRGRAAFVGSGSEANEAALKLARQYHVERGDLARHRVVSRRMSYHGNTLGALAVGGHVGRRKTYQPMLVDTTQIAPCYAYRGMAEGETPEAYGLRVADELAAEIERLGPQTVAAFIVEPVAGATLGSVPPVPGYFRRIREICDRYGVLLIADEVMSGMGRCGRWFAIEDEGVAPDIITVAKGLGAGYQPIGAVLAGERVVEALLAGSGTLANGHTYMSHAVACAGALAVMDFIASEGLLETVRARGAELDTRLRERFADHPHVGDIRGRGLFRSIEIVEDRETKKPFAAGCGIAAGLKARAQNLGLICYPSSGTADGVDGDHVLLAPPYTVSSSEIEEAVALCAAALEETLASGRRAA